MSFKEDKSSSAVKSEKNKSEPGKLLPEQRFNPEKETAEQYITRLESSFSKPLHRSFVRSYYLTKVAFGNPFLITTYFLDQDERKSLSYIGKIFPLGVNTHLAEKNDDQEEPVVFLSDDFRAELLSSFNIFLLHLSAEAATIKKTYIQDFKKLIYGELKPKGLTLTEKGKLLLSSLVIRLQEVLSGKSTTDQAIEAYLQRTPYASPALFFTEKAYLGIEGLIRTLDRGVAINQGPLYVVDLAAIEGFIGLPQGLIDQIDAAIEHSIENKSLFFGD